MSVSSSDDSINACEKMYPKIKTVRILLEQKNTVVHANVQPNVLEVKNCGMDNNKHINMRANLNGSNHSIEISHLWDCGEWTCANEYLNIHCKCQNESKSNLIQIRMIII